ncbi:hypothetical protein H5410_021200 [Solanum commersonii]|uniref:Uncharacterized protein n=1 Tax=Solanum commersonii TaxID=4109 RepID=A0A9J5ZDA9_SOLCO|nr:hypothetical protein H5410_021200 [Solanum commersonii]
MASKFMENMANTRRDSRSRTHYASGGRARPCSFCLDSTARKKLSLSVKKLFHLATAMLIPNLEDG